MYSKPEKNPHPSLFFSLEDTLNPKHPLYLLAEKINWQHFEDAFSPLYSADTGRPAKPVRLMVGLIILRHLRNISDESVVSQFQENAYYQYFCGLHEFSIEPPCTQPELTHFRKRIGEEGARLILQESIMANDDHEKESGGTLYIDSTVQEKNITYPTDAKLLKKVVKRCAKISRDLHLPVRQSYSRTLKRIYLVQRFRGNRSTAKNVAKADRKLRTIAGRLVRELERNLAAEGISGYEDLLSLFYRITGQRRDSKKKVYSIHEPEVECIVKGKEHKKYEFGSKSSIARTEGGLIVAAVSFRAEHDSRTVDPTIDQAELNTGRLPRQIAGDRGYRGVSESRGVPVLIPAPPKKSDSYHKRRGKHRLFCRRAAIEPTIGHLKADHRMGRNFLKGVAGDAINLMLSAAAFNFKRAMNALVCLISRWLELAFLFVRPTKKTVNQL